MRVNRKFYGFVLVLKRDTVQSMYGLHLGQIMGQPDKVANPARGQLIKENE